MQRFIPILFILFTMTGCGVLAPSSADAQKEDSGVTIESDGENLVLIPKDAEKTYLVFGYPRGEKGENQAGSSGPLPSLVGEQRIPAKEYSKVVVLEVRPLTMVDLLLGPSGLHLDQYPCQSQTCDPPLPPGLPRFEALYLVRAVDDPAAALKRKL